MPSPVLTLRLSDRLSAAIETKRAETGETKSQFAQRALAIAAEIDPAEAKLVEGCKETLKQFQPKPNPKKQAKKKTRPGTPPKV